MSKRVRQIQRDRKLTPEEAARYRQIRAQTDQELPAILARRKQASPTGPQCPDDFLDLAEVIRGLKAARDEQGLFLAEVQQRAGVSADSLTRLENGDVNPAVATLERYALADDPVAAELAPADS